jgi:glucosamine-6-phosphate deaminase
VNIITAADYDDLSSRTAALVCAQLAAKPASLFVFPTGATPLGLFRELVAAARTGHADFSAAHFAVLDEYAGIATDDRRSLTGWLKRELLDPLGVPPAHLITFDPSRDASADCARVEAAIALRGGIDVAILGLGPNGHLGFNEPGSEFDTRSALVPLSAASITSNASYWGSEADVPRTGCTLGLGTLFEAEQFVLIVSGAHKAEILARTLRDVVSRDVPATIVRHHPRGTVIADRAALRVAVTGT